MGSVLIRGQDALYIIGQLEIRHEISLAQDKREWFYFLSGGHPGIIQALLKLLKDRPQAFTPMPNAEWCAKQESIVEEFRKISIGLLDDERVGLVEFAHGNKTSMSAATGKLLLTKGMLVPTMDSDVKIFSPLFEDWLSKQ